MQKTQIRTRDGLCDAYTDHPRDAGSWPAVLVFMDGLGIRPAMLAIGEQLASYGYYVLLPDLYYRAGAYQPMDAHAVFSDPQQRRILAEKFFSTATPANIMSDTRSCIDFLNAQAQVRPGGIGTTGYCMGGCMSLLAGGTYPESIVAAASYHAGRLATDGPNSPHRLAPRICARLYIAGASEDPSFPDDMKQRLEQSLTRAGVDHRIETYPARHGWVLRDTPVHDPGATERHWQTLRGLLESKLTRD